jgi:MoaA/NifB/PqqE/SkfB family radical SAM enzyme
MIMSPYLTYCRSERGRRSVTNIVVTLGETCPQSHGSSKSDDVDSQEMESPMKERMIDLWYMSDQAACNFDCAYCVSQPQRRSAQGRMWLGEEGGARFLRILHWIAGLPWGIRVRLSPLGEPFVSKEFLAGAAWLTRQTRISTVELVTNGSFREEQVRRFAADADISRISFWITYHPTEIELDRLLESASVAQSLGAYVVLHGLLFPHNLDVIREMVRACKRYGLRSDVTVGHNYNNAFADTAYLALGESDRSLQEFYRSEDALKSMMVGHQGTLGYPCSAGHDYFFIAPSGDVFQCFAYFRMGTAPLGNALKDAFVPKVRQETYAPCGNPGVCSCKEDYFHLEIARATLRTEGGLGYYVPRG